MKVQKYIVMFMMVTASLFSVCTCQITQAYVTEKQISKTLRANSCFFLCVKFKVEHTIKGVHLNSNMTCVTLRGTKN